MKAKFDEEWIIWATKIVKAWEKKNGRIGFAAQIAHAQSEVSEVYQARKHHKGSKNEIAETADAWLSVLGILSVLHKTPTELLQVADTKLRELERRLKA